MQNPKYYSSEMAQAIIETTAQPFLVLDSRLIVRQANSAFLKGFQVSQEETDGVALRRLGNGQWDIPQLLRFLDGVLTTGKPISDYRVRHTFERIGCRTMMFSATPLLVGKTVDRLLVAILDITEQERLLLDLQGQKEFSGKVVDSSREALLILGYDLKVRAANETFYTQFQVEASATEGRLVYELGDGQWNIAGLRLLLEDILPSNSSFDDFHVEHEFANIGPRVMLLNARRIDHLQLILLAIEDITERRRQQFALKASEERLRKVLETEAMGVIFFNKQGVMIDCNDSFLKMTGYSRTEVDEHALDWRRLTPAEWVQVTEQELEGLNRTGRIGPYEKQYILKDGSRSWMIFAGRDLGDGTVVEFCVDISARKLAEEQRQLLTRELSHRVKNILAVVQSLAMQTAGSAASVVEYRAAFLGRLQALARAQSLLIDSRWQVADVKSLVEEALAPYRQAGNDSVAVDGRSVVIDGRKSVGLILVLHELATNAAKYGAPSQPSGRLDISWREADDDGRTISIVWRERDGPAVKPPLAQGFGSKLIERATQMDLGGTAELDFDPSGLICRLSFPVC